MTAQPNFYQITTDLIDQSTCRTRQLSDMTLLLRQYDEAPTATTSSLTLSASSIGKQTSPADYSWLSPSFISTDGGVGDSSSSTSHSTKDCDDDDYSSSSSSVYMDDGDDDDSVIAPS